MPKFSLFPDGFHKFGPVVRGGCNPGLSGINTNALGMAQIGKALPRNYSDLSNYESRPFAHQNMKGKANKKKRGK